MSCEVSENVRECRPRLELAGIVRSHAHELGELHPDKRKALSAVVSCRTAALGGHLYRCDTCGKEVPLYNSCRKRICPKCQFLQQARWLEAQRLDLLPAEYFHSVFTIASELHELFLANPVKAYGLLFAAVDETLKEVALNPDNLGARLGFICVLHTWTQSLLFHPHIHCIVPGGGLSPDGSRWVACKPGYFLPVQILSPVFRGKLLSKLEHALEAGELLVPAGLDARAALQGAARHGWVVYCKESAHGPDTVLEYLARYTHRIAFSESRLLSHVDGKVTFRCKDRAHGNRFTTVTLKGAEFLRRFLLHVPPAGFMRIRHYGILANSTKAARLTEARELLGVQAPQPAAPEGETPAELLLRLAGVDVTLCPECRKGHLVRKLTLQPKPIPCLYPGRGPPA